MSNFTSQCKGSRKRQCEFIHSCEDCRIAAWRFRNDLTGSSHVQVGQTRSRDPSRTDAEACNGVMECFASVCPVHFSG
jgi:hypothetical protein